MNAEIIEKTCAVTRKGQTTLPLSIRQLLGVSHGGRVVVRSSGGQVTIAPLEEEHRDPAIGAFLGLIAGDVAAGRNIGSLPDDLVETLRQVLQEADIDLDAPIEGDVCL